MSERSTPSEAVTARLGTKECCQLPFLGAQQNVPTAWSPLFCGWWWPAVAPDSRFCWDTPVFSSVCIVWLLTHEADSRCQWALPAMLAVSEVGPDDLVVLEEGLGG